MMLNRMGDFPSGSLPEAISWAYRLLRMGRNAWILRCQTAGQYQVFYEHPRGIHQAPFVGWQIQWHASVDGFSGPVRVINIQAGIICFPEIE